MEERQSLCLNSAEAQRKVRLILREGFLEKSAHCAVRMRERSVTDLDLVHLLRKGRIVKRPEWDEDHGHWKYRVEGADVEGEELTAVTVIFAEDLLLRVVTVF